MIFQREGCDIRWLEIGLSLGGMRNLEQLSIKFTEFKRLFIDDHSNDDGWMMNMNDFSIEMTS